MGTPRLALIGCGAVAENYHLPALARRPDLVRSLVLVDRDLERARAIAAKMGAAGAVADHREVIGRVDGAIVATPHKLHRPITLDFVRSGVHVLCEKPLADTAAEVDEIVDASRAAAVHVLVNQTRRFFTSFQAVHRLIVSGELGEIREIRYDLGEPFAWPAATDAYFGVKSGGRGVLFDTGAHIVDLLCWWMDGEPEVTRYADDSHGGSEAVAELTLTRGATTAHMKLSWLSKLANTYRVTGSRGSVQGGVYEWSSYTRSDASGRTRCVRTDKSTRTLVDFMENLHTNFADAIAGRAQPFVSAADVRPAIAVIDACYARRERLAEPWHDASQELVAHV